MKPTKTLLARASGAHARAAPAVFLIPSLLYLVTWFIEPYLFGVCVLGLAPVQVAWFLAALALAMFRVSEGRATLLVASAGALSATVAVVVLRSVNWA